MEHLRGRLKQARKERGLSIAEVARIMGVPKSTLYSFEYGHRNLSLDNARAYAAAVGLELTVGLEEPAPKRRKKATAQ